MIIIKTLLAIAILIILCIQFFYLIEDLTDNYLHHKKRYYPRNPVKVFKSIDDLVVNKESNIINKLKK